jgi:CheY-like chemotaxis protein
MILVVDDEPDMRALVCFLLEQEGYSVLSASDAEDALALAAHRGDSIQVMLTDVRMPGMGGLALAGKLSRLLPHVRPIFMSGSLSADSAGETPFLRKPFLVHEPLQAVRSRMGEC